MISNFHFIRMQHISHGHRDTFHLTDIPESDISPVKEVCDKERKSGEANCYRMKVELFKGK